MQNKTTNIRKLTGTAMLGAVAAVLMYMEFPIPIMPSFVKLDVSELPALLGDVILSVPRAQAQAEEYGHSFEREMCFLAAHAALHLIGYDHEDEQERERMEARQREVLSSLGIER